MRIKLFNLCVGIFLATCALAGCALGDSLMSEKEYAEFGLQFTLALCERDYARAYAMTGQDFRQQMDQAQLQEAFERMVPLDWGPIEPVQVVTALPVFPGKQAGDIGSVYISIGGEVYSEAVSLIITQEVGALKVRQVEFGRP